jgi:hypothetical protein
VPAQASRGFNAAPPSASAPAVQQPAWRGFGSNRTSSAPNVQRQPVPVPAPAARAANTGRSAGWNSFRSSSSPAAQPAAPRQSFAPQSAPAPGGQVYGRQGGWQRFPGQSGAQAAAPGQATPQAYGARPQWQQGRPALDLRQPVVTRRGAEESGRRMEAPSAPGRVEPSARPSGGPPSAPPSGRGGEQVRSEGRPQGHSGGRSEEGSGRHGR